jgi:chemotaxis family two-component system response regulator Rcp1
LGKSFSSKESVNPTISSLEDSAAVQTARPVEILLVDDDPYGVDLMLEALEDSTLNTNITVLKDGVEAMNYLRGRGDVQSLSYPDFIFLDLNMPRKDGRQVLREMKADPKLSHIPVAVLTTSTAEEDVTESYRLHANCYLTKPTTIDGLIEMLNSVQKFWFGTVILPTH